MCQCDAQLAFLTQFGIYILICYVKTQILSLMLPHLVFKTALGERQ